MFFTLETLVVKFDSIVEIFYDTLEAIIQRILEII